QNSPAVLPPCRKSLVVHSNCFGDVSQSGGRTPRRRVGCADWASAGGRSMSENVGLDVRSWRSGLARAATACSAFEQEGGFAGVACEGRRPLELHAGFVESAELREKVASHARQQMVALERTFLLQLIDELETCRRTERHGHRHRAVQLDDGGRLDD